MALVNVTGTGGAAANFILQDDNYNTPKVNINEGANQSISFGSTAGKVNKVYSDQSSIATSATLSLDLDGGTLEDPFGNANVFTELKYIRITHAASSLASSVSIAGDFMTTAFGASFSMDLEPGGSFLYSNVNAGEAVVSTTGDVIEVLNNDGSNVATVNIDILGD